MIGGVVLATGVDGGQEMEEVNIYINYEEDCTCAVQSISQFSMITDLYTGAICIMGEICVILARL